MVERYFFALSMTLIFLCSCAAWPTNTSHVPEVKRILAPQIPAYEVSEAAEGSLWSATGGIMLYSDIRARKAGDIVTVRIVEDPEAKLNANTKTNRSSGVSVSKLKALGYMQSLAEKNSRLAQNPGVDDLIISSLGQNFDGKGSSDRDGHIKAYISAVVVKVLPNGNLYINGKREIKVNHETQYIALSGIIRPEDVGPSNEIASTYVANAKIAYSGIGPVADKQKPGWLGRVLDHVWPF